VYVTAPYKLSFYDDDYYHYYCIDVSLCFLCIYIVLPSGVINDVYTCTVAVTCVSDICCCRRGHV